MAKNCQKSEIKAKKNPENKKNDHTFEEKTVNRLLFTNQAQELTQKEEEKTS